MLISHDYKFRMELLVSTAAVIGLNSTNIIFFFFLLERGRLKIGFSVIFSGFKFISIEF